MTSDELAQAIFEQAIESGFDNCGIISLSEMEGYRQKLEERMQRVPESRNFYQRIAGLANIKERFSWARSLIICTTWLGKYRYPKQLQGRYAKSYFISPESDTNSLPYMQKRFFTDWLSEQNIRWDVGTKLGHGQVGGLRYAACMAGLGIIRKNNFLYSEKGSYLELDGYVIDKACTLHQKCSAKPCSDNCRICQNACPTKSLSAPYTMNPFKCVSFLTTFGKGKLPEGINKNVPGEWLVGCDACQDCCPYNKKHNWNEGEDFPGLSDILELTEPENILNATDEELITLCPKTVAHIFPEDVNTFRVNAQRVIRNRKNISSL